MAIGTRCRRLQTNRTPKLTIAKWLFHGFYAHTEPTSLGFSPDAFQGHTEPPERRELNHLPFVPVSMLPFGTCWEIDRSDRSASILRTTFHAAKSSRRAVNRRPDQVVLSVFRGVDKMVERSGGPHTCKGFRLTAGNFLPFSVERRRQRINLIMGINSLVRHKHRLSTEHRFFFRIVSIQKR